MQRRGKTFPGRKFKEKPKTPREHGGINVRNLNVQDLQRMLDINTTELENVKEDMQAIQSSNLNKGVSNVMKNQRAFNELKCQNDHREHVYHQLCDQRDSLESMLNRDLKKQSEYDTSLTTLEDDLEAQERNLDLETTQNLILTHMYERLVKEAEEGVKVISSLERELKEAEKEQIASEASFHQSRQEKVAEQQALDKIQRDMEDKRKTKEQRMNMVMKMVKQSRKANEKQRRMVMDTINQLQDPHHGRHHHGHGRDESAFSSHLSSASSTSLERNSRLQAQDIMKEDDQQLQDQDQEKEEHHHHHHHPQGKTSRKTRKRRKRELQKLEKKRVEYENKVKAFFCANLPFQALIEQENRKKADIEAKKEELERRRRRQREAERETQSRQRGSSRGMSSRQSKRGQRKREEEEYEIKEEDLELPSFGHYPESHLILKFLDSQRRFSEDMRKNQHETKLNIQSLKEDVEKVERALHHLKAEKNNRRLQNHHFEEHKDLEIKQQQKHVDTIEDKQQLAQLEVLEISSSLARFLTKITREKHYPPPTSNLQDACTLLMEEVMKLKTLIKSKKTSGMDGGIPGEMGVTTPGYNNSAAKRNSIQTMIQETSSDLLSSMKLNGGTAKRQELNTPAVEDDSFYIFQSIMNSPFNDKPENIRCTDSMRNQEEVTLRDHTSKMVTLLGVEETNRQIKKQQKKIEATKRRDEQDKPTTTRALTNTMGRSLSHEDSSSTFSSIDSFTSSTHSLSSPISSSDKLLTTNTIEGGMMNTNSVSNDPSNQHQHQDGMKGNTKHSHSSVYEQDDFVPQRSQIKQISNMLNKKRNKRN